MSETIKCPKCGEAFTVDGSIYVAILAKFRNAGFNKSIEQSLLQHEKTKDALMGFENNL